MMKFAKEVAGTQSSQCFPGRGSRGILENRLFLIGKLTSQKSLVQNVKFDVGYRYEH